MKLIFMGTPDFAVPTLKALYESSHQILAVYTQPDKEAGRGKKVLFSPVKTYALSVGLPVLQPRSLRKQEVIDEMRLLGADAIVVVAYGQILRPAVLEMTRYGCFNVHASLLPKYRGAAPIQWAILNGETETGVTIMQMDQGLDTGDILKQVRIPIGPEETGDSLFEKLSLLGADPLLEVLKEAEEGKLSPIPQGETTTMYAKMLVKSMGRLDFENTDAEVLERYVRGLNSWPSAYTYRNGKLLKIWKAEWIKKDGKIPGAVMEVTKQDFTVACETGALRILEVQPEGKKRMAADAYLRGYPMEVGEVLGEEACE